MTLSDFSNTVADIVPKLVKATKGFFVTLIETRGLAFGTHPLREDISGITAILKKYNYVDLMKLGIYVPEGFKGDLAGYVDLLEKSTDHALGLVDKVISPFNTYLASLLSTPDAIKDSQAPNIYLGKINKDRDELNNQIGKHFDSSSTQTRIPMGDAVKRMADWEHVMLKINAINKALANTKNETVQKSVDACIELLDSCQAAAKSGQFNQITAANLKALSESTLSIAREVEFYAVTRQRVKILSTAMDDSVDFLKSTLE